MSIEIHQPELERLREKVQCGDFRDIDELLNKPSMPLWQQRLERNEITALNQQVAGTRIAHR